MTILIDSGHGGLDMQGGYVTAPHKMHEHSPGEVFYEGVFNRKIKELLMRKLWEENVKCIDVCPTDLDVPLGVRVNVVNSYHAYYRDALLISLHSNAGGGSGFEIWTSKGQTRSDYYADILGRELMSAFHDLPFRADKTDGDLDKEDDFYILEKTHCPAIMPECLFYDNYNEYLLLENADFRMAYVRTLVNFIRKANNEQG